MSRKMERNTGWMLGATSAFGRDALFGASENAPVVVEADIDRIDPNPHQPRRSFEEPDLEPLQQSLQQHGLQQPIGLKQKDGGRFELVFGERRWRAAKLLGWSTIFGLIVSGDSCEIALIENLQRVDLTPFEECDAFLRLMEVRDYKAADLARIMGRDKADISRTLSLARLPELIRAEYSDWRPARYRLCRLATEKDPARQLRLWEELKAELSEDPPMVPDDAATAPSDTETRTTGERKPASAALDTALPKRITRRIVEVQAILTDLSVRPQTLADADRQRLLAIRAAVDLILDRG